MKYERLLLTIPVACVIAMTLLARANAAGNSYIPTNLVSDGWVSALNIDVSLKNPWKVAFFPGGPFWVADNASNPTGVSTLYDGTGSKGPLTVNISFPAGDTNPGAPGPSGMVWNGNPPAFVVGKTAMSNAAPALFI